MKSISDNMNNIYYVVILFYPLIAAIFSSIFLNIEIFEAIKKAYYLLFGILIFYAGLMLLFLSIFFVVFNFWMNIILFSILFFLIFFIRAYVQTETHDIFSSLPGEKSK